MTRITPFVAARRLACIVAVAASSATPPPITQRRTGKTFRLAKGATMTLRLSNRWRWSDPRVSTKAVEFDAGRVPRRPRLPRVDDPRAQAGPRHDPLGRQAELLDCALATRAFRVTIVVG